MGSYRLTARLGAGGMGVVYLGHAPSGRTVAVKVVRQHLGRDSRYRARFCREVTAARRVTGTFTAPLLDADPDASPPWLAMEHLPGPTLREAVDGFGELPPGAVRLLAAALAEAVAAIHRAGFAHRDLKPGNIVLSVSGPRVIDFGIALPDDATSITAAGALLGTPGFMSPEAAAGERAGPEGDVFALGAVLAYAATGREPFADVDRSATLVRVRQARADLAGIQDAGLRALIASCLRHKPGQRPTAEVLLRRLGQPAESVRGTRWLPPELAQLVDAHTALAACDRHRGPVAHAPAYDPGTTLTPPPSAKDAPRPPGPAPRDRRALLLTVAGVALAGGALALARDRLPDPGPTAPGSASSPTPPTVRSGPSARHPVAVRRWRTRIFRDRASPRLYPVGATVVAADGGERAGALDPRTGRVLWTRATDQHTYGEAISTGDDAVYLFDGRPPSSTEPYVLRALDPLSRAVRWTRRVPFFASGTVATGPVVCFRVDDEVRALAASDGRPRWSARSPGTAVSAGAGLVVAVGGDALDALDARSGRPRWRRELPEAPSYGLVGDGLVFARDVLGTVHALRAHDGSTAWRHPVDYRSSVRHAGNGMLYVGEVDGRVRALRARTGAQVWSRQLGRPGPMIAESDTLHLAGGTLWAQGPEQTVYALDAADGHVTWTYGAWTAPDTQSVTGSRAVSVAGLVLLSTPGGYVEAVEPPS
ncbi:serine/threonine-protein kinase [Streptomyces sp. NPDC057702]|uniref:serine/threonine-protein kinase n=1 Tax=unclassified Streptomyces TaxID=2593676 RepID=UPI00367C63A4